MMSHFCVTLEQTDDLWVSSENPLVMVCFEDSRAQRLGEGNVGQLLLSTLNVGYSINTLSAMGPQLYPGGSFDTKQAAHLTP